MPSNRLRRNARTPRPRGSDRRRGVGGGASASGFGTAWGGGGSAGAAPARAGAWFGAGLSGLVISLQRMPRGRPCQAPLRHMLLEEPPFLDDGGHALRNRRLPAGLSALQASQHVAGIDLENRRVAVLETLDMPVLEEEAGQVPDRIRDGYRLCRDERTGRGVDRGINIDLHGVLEEATDGFEPAAREVMPERMQHLRPIDEITMVDPAFAGEAVERHHHQDHRLPAEVGFPEEPLARALEQRDRHLRRRPEGSQFDAQCTLVEALRWLDDISVRREHHRVGEAELDQLKTRQSTVEAVERGARELDHVDLETFPLNVVQQGLDELRGLRVMIEGGVRKIDADDAERFLLSRGVLVEKKHVDENIGWCATGLCLESVGESALAVLVPRIASRGNRVGDNEKDASIAARWPEPFEKQRILTLEHRLESLAAHVAVALSIHRVAHRGVVCRDGLRHRSRGAADAKEPPRHFLTGTDLREGAVPRGVDVDLQGLLRGGGTRHEGLPGAEVRTIRRRGLDGSIHRAEGRRERSTDGAFRCRARRAVPSVNLLSRLGCPRGGIDPG